MKIKLKGKTFTYRFATEKDIDDINRFDKRINQEIDKRFYFRHTKKMLKNMISDNRKIMLVFYKNKLVAWGGSFSKVNKDYGEIYNLNKKELEQSAVLVAAAVSKRYRGYGLQKFLMQKRIEYLKKQNKKYFLNSVHSDNNYSISNTLDMGFKFKKKAKSLNRDEVLNYYILK